MAYQKRLKKEYEELSKRAPLGITLDESTMEDNIDMWVLGYIILHYWDIVMIGGEADFKMISDEWAT